MHDSACAAAGSVRTLPGWLSDGQLALYRPNSLYYAKCMHRLSLHRNFNETDLLKWPANGRFEKFISTRLANDKLKSGSSLTSTDFEIT